MQHHFRSSLSSLLVALLLHQIAPLRAFVPVPSSFSSQQHQRMQHHQQHQRLHQHHHQQQQQQQPLRSSTLYAGGSSGDEKPFAVVVQARIEPDRMAEFLTMIETNAKETRKEPGCLRFDVLRSQDSPNEFFFYELYKNAAAIDFHKKQPHYNMWADFKASGGTMESTSYKTDAEFLT